MASPPKRQRPTERAPPAPGTSQSARLHPPRPPGASPQVTGAERDAPARCPTGGPAARAPPPRPQLPSAQRRARCTSHGITTTSPPERQSPAAPALPAPLCGPKAPGRYGPARARRPPQARCTSAPPSRRRRGTRPPTRRALLPRTLIPWPPTARCRSRPRACRRAGGGWPVSGFAGPQEVGRVDFSCRGRSRGEAVLVDTIPKTPREKSGPPTSDAPPPHGSTGPA